MTERQPKAEFVCGACGTRLTDYAGWQMATDLQSSHARHCLGWPAPEATTALLPDEVRANPDAAMMVAGLDAVEEAVR